MSDQPVVQPVASTDTVEDDTETVEETVQPVQPVDIDKLPVIPNKLPEVVEKYRESSARGRIQVRNSADALAKLLKFGPVLLSQHHTEAAAEQAFDSDEKYAENRDALEKIEAEAEEALNKWNELQEKLETSRHGYISQIAESMQADPSVYEEADAEYSEAYTSLTNRDKLKNWESAGEDIHNAMKEFVKKIPTAVELVNGQRKGVKSKSTFPGSNSNQGAGWKPTFDWMEIKRPGSDHFERVEGATSIGHLANALDNGKSADRIKRALEPQREGRPTLTDNKEYTWSITVQNEDEPGTESTTWFKALAMSRGAKNARANEQAAAAKAPAPAEVTEAVQPENNEGDSGEDAAVNF